ncbi:MAG: hypothetical protein WCP26_14740 [Actinomycetes bacterium]
MNAFNLPMRPILLAVLALLIVLYALWAIRHGGIDRLTAVVLLALTAVLVWQGMAERSWLATQSRLSAVATEIAGTPVKVHCQRFSETYFSASSAEGIVGFDENGVPKGEADLTYSACRDLAGWLASTKASPTSEQMIAVHVLTHEAMHVSGITAEGIAECEALSFDARTAQLLGATPKQATALAAYYRTKVYPSMPAGYRTNSCRWA